jgi:hypothetical protein
MFYSFPLPSIFSTNEYTIKSIYDAYDVYDEYTNINSRFTIALFQVISVNTKFYIISDLIKKQTKP